MHECSSGQSIIVNAEIDSMGGVLDCGAGTDSKASPRRAAIEKAHSELRQEFDVRDERRRELDFLEKGGNPLDFKLGQVASISVQSTSQTDQHPEQIVSSVAKGNIPPSTSSLGDSIESSERPATVFEPTSADNLLLFELEDDLVGKERSSAHHNERNNILSFEKSSQEEGSKKTKELEDLGNFRPYARRNRSKSNRDGVRSNSTDGIPPRAGLLSSLPARHSFKDTKGVKLETNNLKEQCKSTLANPTYGSTNGDLAVVGIHSDTRIEADLNGLQECSADMINNVALEGVLDVTFANDIKENEQLNVHAPPIVLDRNNMIQPDNISKNERLVSASVKCSTLHVTSSNGNANIPGEPKKVSSSQRDWDDVQDEVQDEVQTSGGAFTSKIIDSGSSCTQSSLSLVSESDMGNADKNAKDMDNVLIMEVAQNPVSGTMVKEYDSSHQNHGGDDVQDETNRADSGLITNDDYDSSHQNHGGDESLVKKEMHTIDSCLQRAVDFSSKMVGLETTDPAEPDNNSEPDREISSTVRHQDTIRSSICEPNVSSSGLDAVDVSDIQTHDYQPKLSDKAHEDSILEEARSIEAKRKRIAELSVHTVLLEKSRKSHWDFVLEEMAWLANDVAQERLWKMATASNISSQVALTSRSRLAEQKLFRNQKKVAFTMAKAVMHFWQSLQELVNSENPSEATDEKELQHGESSVTVKGYGLRFLKYTRTGVPCTQAEAPLSPDSTSSLGVQESLNVEEFMEESLIYLVSFSAMETYRKSIESCLVQLVKTESSAMEEEVDTSMYDVVEDLSQGNTYDEEEGETSMYYNPGSVEESKPSKFSLKKRKNLIMACDGRSYEPEADFPNGQCTMGSNQPILVRKRPATNLNGGCIPTKRVRTASRQRFQNSFSAGAAGSLQAPNRTDGSSGDTNSFQDDQSTFHSGPQLHKCMEVESSATDFEKTLPYDGDMSDKPKKKKRAKHLDSAYDGRWQPDSVNHNEQRVNMKKRLERHLLDSNGSGLTAKKPKMKHSLDNTFDGSSPRNGSIPSSVASQMSNMSNSNKFMKLIGARDRGRKSKSMKISAGQTGSGNPWSLFEDQALVVLVHDMGPNWELVSDAITSTLQFKCIFRKAIECKERHKNLMDRTGGDGVDSAEDSGSSQPYPSTLPGIPKGSARQLFQRLQGPLEEDTLKSHFEKIILIGQRQHYQKIQRDNQEMKQIAPVHNSHAMALSQVYPNNLSGGFLTPLDLCDVSGSSPDVIPHGYQGPQSSGLSITNQGSVSPFLASGANMSLQGSSNMVMGSNMSSPSSATNASIRDGRYVVPRTSPIDEQQRLQQYNSMISSRNIQQSSIPVSGALSGTDRGARMLPGGNGMGMIGGKNRTLPVSRPGFQGIPSPSMLNNGSMLSPSMAGMPIPGTMHHGASSLSRPRETMHIMRPSQTQEHNKQMMLPQHHLQVSPGNNQSVTPLNGLNSSFSNQTASPTPTNPMRSSQQHQVSAPQPHVLQNSPHSHLQGSNPSTGTRHPAYTQLKEGQLHQQRSMQQRHQQYNFNGQPHMQPQVSSSTSQQASHPSSTPSSPQTSMSLQLQQKQNPPPQGFGRNPQTGAIGLNNQLKQRQRLAQQQQFQQTSRQHPPHLQQMQSQQQAKFLKGMGRGNMLKNQNLSIDLSQSNGTCTSPVSQPGGKGEHVVHSMQGQGTGSIRSSVQPPRPEMPLQSSNQTQLQQHLSACSPSLSKQFNQVPSHSDNNSSQGLAQSSSGSHGHDSHQGAPASASDSNHHHHQVHLQQPKNQAQPGGQRLLHLNRHGSSELTSNSIVYQPHVDQHAVNNTSDIDTTASMSQFTMEQTNVTPANYSSRASPWRACEPVHDASMQSPASPLDSVGGSLPRSNSVRPINLVQRQFSGGSVAQHQLEHKEKSQEHFPDCQAPRDESEQHMQHLESG